MYIKDIDEMVSFLTSIKKEHGNLPIMRDDECSRWIGANTVVSNEVKPDGGLEKIKVVYIS